MRKKKRTSARKSWLRRIEQAKYLPQPSAARTLNPDAKMAETGLLHDDSYGRHVCNMAPAEPAFREPVWWHPAQDLQSTESATSHLHVLAQSQSSSFPHICQASRQGEGCPAAGTGKPSLIHSALQHSYKPVPHQLLPDAPE